MGGKDDSRHIKAFIDALFKTFRNLANNRYLCLELSNGRCPGCDYISLVMYASMASHHLWMVDAVVFIGSRGNVYSYRRGL